MTQQRPDAPELAAYGDYEVGTRPLYLTNPDQLDVLALAASDDAPDPLPTHDRELVLQMWYPAFAGATGSKTLRAFLRDPTVEVDHTDSTYRTQAAFGSTLRNRSLDQLFVLNEMARLNADSGSFLQGLMDTDNSGLIGYSMGGYGAVITAGGGVTAASVAYPFSPPYGTLGIHESGSETHNNLPDSRIKTAIAFAPWGRNVGFFDAVSLEGVQIPMLFVAGSQDDVSLYEDGVRAIWEESVNVDRALLTFENANHNAAAPYPAPEESYAVSTTLGYPAFGHYADAVWDTSRMNNIAQHFSTAWLDRYLKNDADKQVYLELLPDSNDGVFVTDEAGNFTDEHTYWAGFQDRTAKGLEFEWLKAGESANE